MASYSFTFTVVVSQLKNMSNPAIKFHFVRDCVSKTERHEISLVVPLIPCVHKMRHCGEYHFVFEELTYMNSGRWGAKTIYMVHSPNCYS